MSAATVAAAEAKLWEAEVAAAARVASGAAEAGIAVAAEIAAEMAAEDKLRAAMPWPWQVT